MGDEKSGSTTVVNSQPSPPQLLPEAKEGFNQAQSFYKGILGAPPVYGGQRLAGITPAQTSALNQQYDYFGAPQPFQLAAEDQAAATARGGYLGGPESQQAMASLADPIFARFRDESLPQIRDRSQFAGQGISGTRREVANTNAIEGLGRQLALSAYAPIYNLERDRMLKAAEMTPTLLGSEALRTGQLAQAGAQERGFTQEALNTARQAYEEPIFRQSQAASSLLTGAGYGPGGSTSTTNTTTDAGGSGVANTAINAGTTALLAYALLGGKK